MRENRSLGNMYLSVSPKNCIKIKTDQAYLKYFLVIIMIKLNYSKNLTIILNFW